MAFNKCALLLLIIGAVQSSCYEKKQNEVDSSTSTFFNQNQNVLALQRNIERRLINMRNVEMRVAKIQEIFDMHFNMMSKNYSDLSVSSVVKYDMRLYSSRLSKKLQKATNIVQGLRDFLRYNISTLMLQSHFDDAEDTDFDFEIEDLDSISDNTEADAEGNQEVRLYLNTYIQTVQNQAGIYPQLELHYNKQQIQILNYLKTDDDDVDPMPHAPYGSGNKHGRSIEANNLIAEKLRNIKATITETTDNSNAINVPDSNGNHFKHIYFLSRSDHASDRNERNYYNTHFRHLYVSAIKQKFVLFLIDVGSAMNVEVFELTKIFVQNVLQLLSETDLLSVISVSNETQLMLLDEQQYGIYHATRGVKEEVLNYINSLGISKTITNHSLAFEKSFQHLERLQNVSLITATNPIEFVYITRGLLTNLSDTMHVLNIIANGQRALIEPIVINTCAVILDKKRIMYEKQFLSDLATQNYTKYAIKVDDWYKPEETFKQKVLQHKKDYLSGKFFVLTKSDPAALMRASTAIFDSLFEERFLTQALAVHLPALDDYSKEMLVSITHAVAPFGVVGVNLYLSDLIEDVVIYGREMPQKKNYNYAFLIDRNGITLAHPAFPRPFAQAPAAFPVDIGFLENSTDFVSIRRKMLQMETGDVSTTIYVDMNKRSELMDRTYHWQSVLGIYVLCLVTTSKKEMASNAPLATLAPSTNSTNEKVTLQNIKSVPLILQKFNVRESIESTPLHTSPPVHAFPQSEYAFMSTMDMVYHRLDLLPTTTMPRTTSAQQQNSNVKLCRYFRQVATLDAATLFLSPSAFVSPFTFLHNSQMSNAYAQSRVAESIMAYIKDTTGLLANPGLRPQIRHEVNILYSAMQYLKKRHQDARGTLKNYIIRRYIATVSGVLQVYPGCLLSDNYDATRRPWFRRAMQQPGRIISTEPYLDAGGAGYIITIAHTIFEGKANALHSIERDQPVAIVALDVPYAFYYKLILETTPVCHQANIKCLLFENDGFLVAHPSMLEPSTIERNPRRPHEHLTHKELYLANDILNHKTLVRKLACANYQNRTLQRYYTFNTSLVDILTNVLHGERTKYAIALIRGSNIFAAVLNSTCDGGAFCPCNTINRVCLNCNRMDQMDCECPCECPIEGEVFDAPPAATDSAEEDEKVSSHTTATTAGAFNNYTQQYSFCEPPNENFAALPITMSDQLLNECVNINCDVYGTVGDCLAIMGCEWCQQDLDGNSFPIAFCTTQAACFNGVLASPTPYGDLDDIDISAQGYNPGQKNKSYSALGPVGGAIVVLGIVIGFAIYCYRHNVDAHTQEFYIDSMQEENYGLPLSRFNFDDCQGHDDPPGSGGYDHPAAQRNLIHPADISPYHVSTGSSYRRPPNGESDNGYSTMTPHEDSSDHQCFTLAEPLLLHDKRHSKSDTVSISTSISSPTNRQQQPHQPPYPIPPTQQQHTSKDARYNHITSPKKSHGASSPARVYEQTTLPLHAAEPSEMTQISSSPHYILAPVTVHRHMETSES